MNTNKTIKIEIELREIDAAVFYDNHWGERHRRPIGELIESIINSEAKQIQENWPMGNEGALRRFRNANPAHDLSQ